MLKVIKISNNISYVSNMTLIRYHIISSLKILYFDLISQHYTIYKMWLKFVLDWNHNMWLKLFYIEIIMIFKVLIMAGICSNLSEEVLEEIFSLLPIES